MPSPRSSTIWTALLVVGILVILFAGCMIFGLSAIVPVKPPAATWSP